MHMQSDVFKDVQQGNKHAACSPIKHIHRKHRGNKLGICILHVRDTAVVPNACSCTSCGPCALSNSGHKQGFLAGYEANVDVNLATHP